jgi:hypothetical protein
MTNEQRHHVELAKTTPQIVHRWAKTWLIFLFQNNVTGLCMVEPGGQYAALTADLTAFFKGIQHTTYFTAI